MSGTLFGLPLSQQFDTNGDPLAGALLYLYQASTSTPVISYTDSGLLTANTWPLEADASGRIPQFWLADGSYRARLTTAQGVEVFDIPVILAIGASSGSGGGGGSSVDANAIFATGDMLWQPISGVRTGWVRANARTIGNGSSAGTERANADTQALFEYLWNNFTNALCPVSTGRGGSSATDYAANKNIGTLDMRGYGVFGLDDMGNSAAGRLVTATPTVAASATGLEKTSITVAQANLPSYSLDVSGLNIKYDFSTTTQTGGSGTRITAIGSASATTSTGGVAGTLPSGGSGTALTPTTISPGRLGSWYLRL